jgi:hypothetical protein
MKLVIVYFSIALILILNLVANNAKVNYKTEKINIFKKVFIF